MTEENLLAETNIICEKCPLIKNLIIAHNFDKKGIISYLSNLLKEKIGFLSLTSFEKITDETWVLLEQVLEEEAAIAAKC